MEKLKVGVLGLRRGLTHFRNFLRLDNVELIGAADRYEHIRDRAAEHAASEGASPTMVAEFDELLAMKPDAVMIASNGRLQAEHSCMALEAGCHVLSEVPGAFTPEEFVRIRAAAELSGKQYMMAENACFWDFLRYWRKWVANGDFGAISIGEAEYLHYIPGTYITQDGGSLPASGAAAEDPSELSVSWRADQAPIQYLTHDLGPLLEVLDDRAVSVTCRSAPWRNSETPFRSDGQIALFTTQKGNLLKVMVTLNTRRPEEAPLPLVRYGRQRRVVPLRRSQQAFYEGCRARKRVGSGADRIRGAGPGFDGRARRSGPEDGGNVRGCDPGRQDGAHRHVPLDRVLAARDHGGAVGRPGWAAGGDSGYASRAVRWHDFLGCGGAAGGGSGDKPVRTSGMTPILRSVVFILSSSFALVGQ